MQYRRTYRYELAGSCLRTLQEALHGSIPPTLVRPVVVASPPGVQPGGAPSNAPRRVHGPTPRQSPTTSPARLEADLVPDERAGSGDRAPGLVGDDGARLAASRASASLRTVHAAASPSQYAASATKPLAPMKQIFSKGHISKWVTLRAPVEQYVPWPAGANSPLPLRCISCARNLRSTANIPTSTSRHTLKCDTLFHSISQLCCTLPLSATVSFFSRAAFASRPVGHRPRTAPLSHFAQVLNRAGSLRIPSLIQSPRHAQSWAEKMLPIEKPPSLSRRKTHQNEGPTATRARQRGEGRKRGSKTPAQSHDNKTYPTKHCETLHYSDRTEFRSQPRPRPRPNEQTLRPAPACARTPPGRRAPRRSWPRAPPRSQGGTGARTSPSRGACR